MDQPLPPTPAEATRAALAQGAQDAARSALTRRLHTFARQRLPGPVYKLLFGGKSAGELAEEEARKRIRNLLWGCGFSAVFGCLVALVLVLVAGIVAWAVFLG
jgi:hypothetical protein